VKTLFNLFICWLLLSCSIASADSYKYIDDEGNVHFTDDPYNVPLNKLDDVKIYKESRTKLILKEEKAPSPEDIVADQINEREAKEAEYSDEYDRLKKEKRALDKEYKALLKEQNKIIELTKKADEYTHKKKQALQDRLDNSNKKIKDFNIRQKTFNEKVQAFNEKNKSSETEEKPIE